ncbi:MAG: ABC transporter permease [Planctomycetaceae bacterium]|nr:ABC transporter permease [Planctomycetaceae bacterium]
MDAFIITVKDLRLLLRDRRALVVLVVLPVILIAVVGSSIGKVRADRELRNAAVEIQVVDRQQSERSIRLCQFLAAQPRIRAQAVETKHPGHLSPASWMTFAPKEDVIRLVLSRESDPRMPPDRVAPESDPVRQDSVQTSVAEAGPVRMVSFAEEHITLLAPQSVDSLRFALAEMAVRLSLQQERTGGEAPVRIEPGDVEQSSESVKQQVYQLIVPGYTVLFVFFLITIMGRSFIAERDLGTLRRLLISPIQPGQILTGKVAPFFVLSLIQTGTLLLTAHFLFGMSLGSQPWLLIPVVFAGSLCATTLGLLFATLVRNDAQVSSIGNLIVLSTAGISGCMVPREWMPDVTQKISLITPHAWALKAWSEVLSTPHPSVTMVAGHCGILLLFSGAFFVLGLRRFQRTRAA